MQVKEQGMDGEEDEELSVQFDTRAVYKETSAIATMKWVDNDCDTQWFSLFWCGQYFNLVEGGDYTCFLTINLVQPLMTVGFCQGFCWLGKFYFVQEVPGGWEGDPGEERGDSSAWGGEGGLLSCLEFGMDSLLALLWRRNFVSLTLKGVGLGLVISNCGFILASQELARKLARELTKGQPDAM